jgi:hypothetical protein
MSNKVVSSRVRLNIKKIGQLNSSSIKALEKTGEALHTEVVKAQVMPFDSGTMQNDSTYIDKSKSAKGVVSLITDTPYSRRMYFHPEYNFQTTNNANAQGQWLESWISGNNKDFCIDAFAKFYKKEAGL